MGQRDGLAEVVAVERRNHAEAGQGLETVADAHHQFAVGDELLKLVVKPELDPFRENRAAAEMVPEAEAADEDPELILLKFVPARDQVVQVDLFGSGADQLAGGGGFTLAVQAEAGDDQNLDIRFFHVLSVAV